MTDAAPAAGVAAVLDTEEDGEAAGGGVGVGKCVVTGGSSKVRKTSLTR